MGLKTPEQLGANGNGLSVFGYIVEFAEPAEGSTFANPRTGPWKQRLVTVNQITIGYGSRGQTARLSSLDPNAITDDTMTDAKAMLVVPKNGECLRISIRDAEGNWVPVFKGTIRNMHEKRSDTGIIWNCEAISEINRLDEMHVTASYNHLDDPLRPSPHFVPGTGTLMSARRYTVKEIIEEVMNFPDAWGTQEYFGVNDIDWQGLDTSDFCGRYIPANITFDNQSKGAAIESVLQAAGSYNFIYDPTTDKIKIVELNLDCNRCGAEWPIVYAPDTADGGDAESAYAYDYMVKSDDTVWSTRESANCCRIVSGPIQFYSGHRIIPERVVGGETHTVADGTDTTDLQKKRATSLDGCYYRFSMPTQVGVHDTRKIQRYYVGMPLFPDWNIFEDWFPSVLEINTPFVPPEWRAADYTEENLNVKPGSPNPADYKDNAEFQPFCLGDAAARKEIHLGHQDNLRAYQAWFTTEICPACNGYGLVTKVFNNEDNEPDLKLVSRGPEGFKRMVIECTNWIMKPSDFGQIDPQTKKRLAPPAGLTPFYGSGGPTASSPVPLPWKNTCPYCRGVGMKPEFKIRNISQKLFENRNLQVDPQVNTGEIPTDPEYTQTGPETWDQANQRVSNVEGPMLQVEVPVAYRYSIPDSRDQVNATWADLDKLAKTFPDKVRHKFPHPLQYKNVKKHLLSVANVSVHAGDANGQDKIVPDNWYCTVPFTTVMMGSPAGAQIDYQMGRVIFAEPVFIPCRKEWATAQVLPDNRVRILPNGMVSTQYPARGYSTSDEKGLPTGFWRPARVWMSHLYSRDMLYDLLLKNPATNQSIAQSIITTDGNRKYKARASIIDGRWALEVMRLNPDETEIAGGRVIQTAHSDDGAVIQIYEPDLWKMPVISLVDIDSQDAAMAPDGVRKKKDLITAAKTAANYDYTVGKIFKWQRPSQGELMLESEGYTSADHFSSLSRPVTYTWTFRDDRSKLLGKAIRQLEITNDIQVTGTLTVVGLLGNLTNGLGYVTYRDRGKVSVVNVTYNFSEGFVTELELHRVEARIGELMPTDQERMNKLVRTVDRLRRISSVGKGNGNSQTTTQSRSGPLDTPTSAAVTNQAG